MDINPLEADLVTFAGCVKRDAKRLRSRNLFWTKYANEYDNESLFETKNRVSSYRRLANYD